MISKRLQFWLWAGLALIAGLALRLWFIRHMALIAGDSLMYGDIARNWILHGTYGFTETTGTGAIEIRPTLIRLPGYPMFLAACFRIFGMEHYHAVMYLQVGADLLTCWLASALAGRLFGDRAALVVLWLAALCPFTASYVATPMTETLVLTMIALAFYSFARWLDAGRGTNRWLWVVAAALTYSILLRPEQALLAATLLAAILWTSLSADDHHRLSSLRSAVPAVAAALCIALSLAPWAGRNWRTFHVFQPLAPRYANDPGELPPTGFSRWFRTWATSFNDTENVYWNYSTDPIKLEDIPPRAFELPSTAASRDLRIQTAALIAAYNARTKISTDVDPDLDARFDALGIERIHAHPVLYYFALPVARLFDMTFRPRVAVMDAPLDWDSWSTNRRACILAAADVALNLAYFTAGLAGLWVWRCRALLSADPSHLRLFRQVGLAMAASFVLRVLLLLTIDNSEPRYTLEFFPLLFVWAGALFAPRAQPSTAE